MNDTVIKFKVYEFCSNSVRTGVTPAGCSAMFGMGLKNERSKLLAKKKKFLVDQVSTM